MSSLTQPFNFICAPHTDPPIYINCGVHTESWYAYDDGDDDVSVCVCVFGDDNNGYIAIICNSIMFGAYFNMILHNICCWLLLLLCVIVINIFRRSIFFSLSLFFALKALSFLFLCVASLFVLYSLLSTTFSCFTFRVNLVCVCVCTLSPISFKWFWTAFTHFHHIVSIFSSHILCMCVFALIFGIKVCEKQSAFVFLSHHIVCFCADKMCQVSRCNSYEMKILSSITHLEPFIYSHTPRHALFRSRWKFHFAHLLVSFDDATGGNESTCRHESKIIYFINCFVYTLVLSARMSVCLYEYAWSGTGAGEFYVWLTFVIRRKIVRRGRHRRNVCETLHNILRELWVRAYTRIFKWIYAS